MAHGGAKTLRILCGYWDMGTGRHKKYHKICEISTYINIRYIFAYVFPMFATSPSTIMEAAFGRLHNNGGAAFGGPPIVVESIMVDGEVANIGKTYANMYRIFMYMYISHILIYFPYVIPGAISLAKSVCMH